MTRAKIMEQIEKLGLHYHHTSWYREYVSRKTDGYITNYKGRFGEGIAWYRPSWHSTTYCYVVYYVK